MVDYDKPSDEDKRRWKLWRSFRVNGAGCDGILVTDPEYWECLICFIPIGPGFTEAEAMNLARTGAIYGEYRDAEKIAGLDHHAIPLARAGEPERGAVPGWVYSLWCVSVEEPHVIHQPCPHCPVRFGRMARDFAREHFPKDQLDDQPNLNLDTFNDALGSGGGVSCTIDETVRPAEMLRISKAEGIITSEWERRAFALAASSPKARRPRRAATRAVAGAKAIRTRGGASLSHAARAG
jgi:hypothetical protein